MHKMKKILLVIILFAGIGLSSEAQSYYRYAVGLRVGPAFGISGKHFLNRNTAIEGIFQARWRGVIVTGLYEYSRHAFRTPGLVWYIGGGGHIGYWKDYTASNYWWNYEENPGSILLMGADFILGLEYSFKDIPLNLSIDWKPAVNFFGYVGFWGDMMAISIRYAIW